jgi:glycosyltransferase involved in cell wall biosynthesis
MKQHLDLCVVGPVYNEEAVLGAFHKRLTNVLCTMNIQWEIVYVNDGSRDGSAAILEALHASDKRVSFIELSRNFGKEIATSVGLDYTRAKAVVLIDTDLQDPPELIPELYTQFLAGYDNVYAQRRSRQGETIVKRFTARMFYRLLHRVSRIRIPVDTGDFRLLSLRAVEALRQLREQHRYMKGLYAWIGFKDKCVEYDRDPRYAGSTKFNFGRLFQLALEGITSFSVFPLKLASLAGLLTALVTFGYGLYMLVRTLLFGNPVAGYPSLLLIVLFLGGIQLLALGMIGEYLGRIFNETKNRPLYFVSEHRAAPLEILLRQEETPTNGSPRS